MACTTLPSFTLHRAMKVATTATKTATKLLSRDSAPCSWTSSWILSNGSDTRRRGEDEPFFEDDPSEEALTRRERGALGFGVGDHIASDADPREVPGEIRNAIEKRRSAVTQHDEQVGIAPRMTLPARERAEEPHLADGGIDLDQGAGTLAQARQDAVAVETKYADVTPLVAFLDRLQARPPHLRWRVAPLSAYRNPPALQLRGRWDTASGYTACRVPGRDRATRRRCPPSAGAKHREAP